jgi:hypothetical protein
MSRVTYPGAHEAPIKEKCECKRDPCPACGELECLCRPRFFAGQLLTERELNLLDRYITAKNRLHNRHLHGWGVVGGLEVLCHSCEGHVSVKKGYALSPCGDDIVVCRDETVDVCKRIDACIRKEREKVECDPPVSSGNGACEENVEKWVLAVRYRERPSRGITALMGVRTDGHDHGDCCTDRRYRTNSIREQCEPTVTCEGYDFEVYRMPGINEEDEPGEIFLGLQPEQIRKDYGEMAYRFVICLLKVLSFFPKELPAEGAKIKDWKDWCCDVKAGVKKLMAKFLVYECQLSTQLKTFDCPTPKKGESVESYRMRVALAIVDLMPIAAEYLRYCLCSALLPPCPETSDDPRVPLAIITVTKKECTILGVCNWEVRKFATTFPNLQYWLSPLPFGRMLREVIDKLCCKEYEEMELEVDVKRSEEAQKVANSTYTAMHTRAARTKDLSMLLLQSISNVDRPVNSTTLFAASLGLTNKKTDRPFMTEEEMKYPLQAILLNQAFMPIMFSFIPDNLSAFIRSYASETLRHNK